MFQGEPKSAFTDNQYVICPFEHDFGYLRGSLDVLQTRDRTGTARRSVHDAGIEFDIALFIRQSAIAYRTITWVFLHDIDAGNDGIERIFAFLDHLHRFCHAQDAAIKYAPIRTFVGIRAGNDDRAGWLLSGASR